MRRWLHRWQWRRVRYFEAQQIIFGSISNSKSGFGLGVREDVLKARQGVIADMQRVAARLEAEDGVRGVAKLIKNEIKVEVLVQIVSVEHKLHVAPTLGWVVHGNDQLLARRQWWR